MLATVVGGILIGARGCEVISEWIRAQDPKTWHALGYFRKPPCANAFRKLLAKIDPSLLEDLVRQWVAALLGEPPREKLSGLSLDGKTARSTLPGHDGLLHLLALLDHRSQCVISEQAVDKKTNEAKAALELLTTVPLPGRVVTGDAMFCQRDVCQQIIDSGGDYLVVVKDNQPSLQEAIAAEFRPGLSPL